jgi:hypothetical protein
MAREKGLWSWLGTVLPPGQYSRIESPDTSPGFPDVHYQLKGGSPIALSHSGTIELKSADRPGAKIPFTDRHGMRKSQLMWIRDNLRFGGIVWVMAEIAPEILVFRGEQAKSINGSPQDVLREMAFVTLTRRDPERAVRQLHYLLINGMGMDYES